MRPNSIVHALAASAIAASAAFAQSARPPLDSATIAGFRWRTVGPANFEGRTSDIAAIPSPSKTFFVAAAAEGIWKTTNGGVTSRPPIRPSRPLPGTLDPFHLRFSLTPRR